MGVDAFVQKPASFASLLVEALLSILLPLVRAMISGGNVLHLVGPQLSTETHTKTKTY